jgi:hypothetical protein
MDEDKFDISARKFPKVVGITAQREIENAVREALNAGRLKDEANLKARMTLEIGGRDHAFGRRRYRTQPTTGGGVPHQHIGVHTAPRLEVGSKQAAVG